MPEIPDIPTHAVPMDQPTSPEWAQQERWDPIIRQLCLPCKEHGTFRFSANNFSRYANKWKNSHLLVGGLCPRNFLTNGASTSSSKLWRLLREIEPEHLVLERLAELSASLPTKTVECLALIIKGDKNGWVRQMDHYWRRMSLLIVSRTANLPSPLTESAKNPWKWFMDLCQTAGKGKIQLAAAWINRIEWLWVMKNFRCC